MQNRNLLQMIKDLPPLPLTAEELVSLNEILVQRFYEGWTEEEFVNALSKEREINPLVANIDQAAFLNYFKKWSELATALSSKKSDVTSHWDKLFTDENFDDNKFFLWLLSSLPENKEKLSALNNKIKEASLLTSGTKADTIFAALNMAIQFRFKRLDKETKREITTFRVNMRKIDEPPEIKQERIKIAQAFKSELELEDSFEANFTFSKYFSNICVKDYPDKLDEIISNLYNESEFLDSEYNESEFLDCEYNESEFLDSEGSDFLSFINNNVKLKNLIDDYLTIDFNIENEITPTEEHQIGYLAASFNAAGSAAKAVGTVVSYFDPRSYSSYLPFTSIWNRQPQAQEQEQPLLQFVEPTGELNNIEDRVILKY